MSQPRTFVLRLQHRVTAYHWRHNRRSNGSLLGICSCGWHARFLRKIAWMQRRRYLRKLCWLRGHDLGPVEDVHTGPVDFEESEDTYWYSTRQCSRCWMVKEVARERS